MICSWCEVGGSPGWIAVIQSQWSSLRPGVLLTAPSAVPAGVPWALGVSSHHGPWVSSHPVGLRVPRGLLWAAIRGPLGPPSLGRAVWICPPFSRSVPGCLGLVPRPARVSTAVPRGSRGSPVSQVRCPAQGLPLPVLWPEVGAFLSCSAKHFLQQPPPSRPSSG